MHAIDMTNDRANIAYTGELPWHGLGQELPGNAGIEVWREAAGLNWKIEPRAVFHGVLADDGSKKAATIAGKKALVRSDTQECLSIMSDKYKIVQPGEVLEFYRDLVETSDRFTLETAGCLFDGRKVWALARGNLDLRIAGQDLIKPYLLLSTSCDGSMATTAQFTTVRVVCNNTLSLSVSQEKANAIRVPHSRVFDPMEVKAELGLIDSQLAQFGHDADMLAAAAISNAGAVDYFAELYLQKDEQGNVTNEKNGKRIVNELMALYLDGPGAQLVSSKGTAWGLVNAVTRFEDFHTRARSNNNRFNSGQFGPGANRKAQAFDSAKALALVA